MLKFLVWFAFIFMLLNSLLFLFIYDSFTHCIDLQKGKHKIPRYDQKELQVGNIF